MFLELRFRLLLLSLICLLAGTAVADDRSTTVDGQLIREMRARFDQGDPGWKARMQSLVRIAQLGPDVVPGLVEALQNGAPSTREFAAQALGMFHDPRARPALGEFGPKAREAVGALIQLLQDEDQETRRRAAKALQKIDPQAARKAGVR
ncbi:MAG: HEAT repeat domain-containing protein [Gemmataceae bacterium]|nr:HEAT repeat domain-containing protein [Gemmataceae bacterium]